MIKKFLEQSIAAIILFLLCVILPIGFFTFFQSLQPKRGCILHHEPSGCIWYLDYPPLGHRDNISLGLPDQYDNDYYYFKSVGSSCDRKFLNHSDTVKVPIRETTFRYED